MDDEYRSLAAPLPNDDVTTKQQHWYASEPVQYFISISLGIVAGITLNIAGASSDLIIIATLPGNLFLRALQCAVIPVSKCSVRVRE